MARSLSMMPPITTSEWPPMYLVKEWTTISAPRSKGFYVMYKNTLVFYLEVRCEESIVDSEGNILGLAYLCYSGNVAYLECGICWSLSPHHLGIRLDSRFHRFQVSEINEVNLHSLLIMQDFPEVSLSAAIHVVNAKHVIALLQQIHHCQSRWTTTVQSESVLRIL